MTALLAEGFEGRRTQAALELRYDNTSFTACAFVSGVNFGTAMGRETGPVGGLSGRWRTPAFTADDEIVVGMRFLCTTPDASGFPAIALHDAGTEVCRLQCDQGIVDTDNFILRFKVGAATLASSQELNKDTWYYIELKVLIDDAAGAYSLKINETVEFSDTGVDTDNTGNSQADAVQFEWLVNSGTARVLFDDITVINTLGSAPDNDFLGDVQIEGLLPDGDGNSSDWTPSSGADNYLMVDEADASDGDTTYVTTSSAGQTDLYTFANMQNATGGTIYFLEVTAWMRLVAAGSRDMRIVTRNTATTANGSTQAVASTSEAEYSQIWEQDPVGASAWTESVINASEFGVESVT